MKYRDTLQEQGYVPTPFGIDYETRLRLAHLGSQLIEQSIDDETLLQALTFSPQPNCPGKPITSFEVGHPRVAKDDSEWLHTGLQTEENARRVYENNLPELLSEFFVIQRAVIDEVILQWTAFLEDLLDEPADAIEMLGHQDILRNNVILRFVRYPHLENYTQENGTFSAHGDISTLTMQLFNSHDGHLRIMPYPVDMITDKVDKKRYDHVKALHSKATAASYNRDSQAATFLGFGAANYRGSNGEKVFHGLHAGYHVGIPPTEKCRIEPQAEELFGKNTRLTIVAFGHPHYDFPYTRYRTPTTEAARPEQVWEKNTLQDM